MKSIKYLALVPYSKILDAKTNKNTVPDIIDVAHIMPNTKTSNANPDKQDLGNVRYNHVTTNTFSLIGGYWR